MTTANDLIQSAHEKINTFGVGQVIPAADLARSLASLNTMLDSWNTEPLNLFAWQTISIPLTVNKGSYTIGTSGTPDVNTTRPLDVRSDDGGAYLQDSLGNNYPITVVTQDIWQSIGNRTVNSQIPDTLFYDPQFPLGIINIYPLPLLNYTLVVNAVLQLGQFSNLTSVFSLPPGYQDAIEHNLACRLWPIWNRGKDIPRWLLELAKETKGLIKRANIREVVARYDSEIVSRGSGSYNIYRDGRGSST